MHCKQSGDKIVFYRDAPDGKMRAIGYDDKAPLTEKGLRHIARGFKNAWVEFPDDVLDFDELVLSAYRDRQVTEEESDAA